MYGCMKTSDIFVAGFKDKDAMYDLIYANCLYDTYIHTTKNPRRYDGVFILFWMYIIYGVIDWYLI